MNHRNTQPRLNVLQAGLLLLSLALAPLAHSENLTEDDVTSFIASMEAMQPLIDKHQDFIESIEDPADDEREVDFARMMSSMVDEVKGHEMYDDLDDLVDDFGFSSPEAWARKGDASSAPGLPSKWKPSPTWHRISRRWSAPLPRWKTIPTCPKPPKPRCAK